MSTRFEILRAVVGSQAYGLQTADSDTDYYGVHAVPTLDLVSLHRPPEDTITSKDPDFVSHEIGKFCQLAAQGNPTVNEVLWLDRYELVEQPFGVMLLDIRSDFLSRRVKSTYLGYANQQFKKLEEKARFSKVPVSRVEKHARHLLRLLEQGSKLWLTGHLEVKPESPNQLRERATYITTAPGGPNYALKLISETADLFEKATPLPEAPNAPAINALLHKLRTSYLEDLSQQPQEDAK